MATKGFLVGDNSVRPRRPVRYLANKQTGKTTKRKKKKPEWDSTVNDLTVHRASKEDQLKRHELHKSKNATKELLQRQLKDASLDSTMLTPDTVERRKLAIVQEVLYGHDKLQDVLSESDKAMSVVKDLFGDDPKKFMGFPNITAAPCNVLRGKENRFPVVEAPETPTHLSMLSDSVMRTPALNELSDDDKEDDEMSPGTPTAREIHEARSTFQPMLDLQRFQQYVAEEQSRYMENPLQPIPNGCGPDHVASQGSDHVHVAPYGRGSDHVAAQDSISFGSDKVQDKPGVYPLEVSQPYFYPQGAVTTVGIKMNDKCSEAFEAGHGTEHLAPLASMASRTDRESQQTSSFSQESGEIISSSGPSVEKPVATAESTVSNSIPPNTRPSSRHTEVIQQRSSKTNKAAAVSHQSALSSSASGLRSLDDLKKMVEQLENEISAYETETGRTQTNVSMVSASGSFSGYTASLITAVTKLMGYLKESEIQRKAEMIMREQVLLGFEEQRVLVDALTNDILNTQEQNLALRQELLEYRKTTDEQLQYLKKELFAVLKSHEYQELSNSINTLYNSNPVPLKQGTLEQASENHNLEYLPRVQTPWVQDIAQFPNVHRTGTSQRASQGCTQPTLIQKREEPSFIPLADSQRIDASLPQVNQTQNRLENSYRPVQSNVESTTGNLNDQQRFVTSMPVYDRQLLSQNGHYSSGRDGAVPPSVVNYAANGNKQLSSNIVIYPPGQGSFSVHQMSTASTPDKQPSILPLRSKSAHQSSVVGHLTTSTAPPAIKRADDMTTALSGRSEPKQFTDMVGNLVTSTASQKRGESVPSSSIAGSSRISTAPLYSSDQYLPSQSVSSAQLQIQNGQPVSMSLEPTQPSRTSKAVPTNVSEAVPQVAASGLMPAVEARSIPHGSTSQSLQANQQQQQQPSQHVDTGLSTKTSQRPQKPNGFVPFSRALAGSLPATHQLRERLQNLANKQKSAGGVATITQYKGESREGQQPRPSSPHVHFKEPPVAGDGYGTVKEQGETSPTVSPIPHKKATVAHRSTVPPDNRVVVNLPNAWSDVSSTISL